MNLMMGSTSQLLLQKVMTYVEDKWGMICLGILFLFLSLFVCPSLFLNQTLKVKLVKSKNTLLYLGT